MSDESLTPDEESPAAADGSLTPEEFLRLKKSDIEALFEETLPASTGKDYFEPDLYDKRTDPLLTKMKKWKADSTAKGAERKSILNFVIPAMFIAPGLISIIIAGGWAKHTSIVITVSAIITITYLWFFGRVWAWEAKNYQNNVEHAESALNRTTHNRAKAWATERYDINTDNIEWSQYSNFYIDGIGYLWKEYEDGKYRIYEVESGKEAPLLTDV